MADYPIKTYSSFNDKLPFGKHKSKTLDEIIDVDPGYLKWAVLNNVLKLSPEIEAEVIKAAK